MPRAQTDSQFLLQLTKEASEAGHAWNDRALRAERHDANLNDLVAALYTLTVAQLHTARQLALMREERLRCVRLCPDVGRQSQERPH